MNDLLGRIGQAAWDYVVYGTSGDALGFFLLVIALMVIALPVSVVDHYRREWLRRRERD